ncbi:hypothetical protein HMPREF9104_00005 [Lentilactobacillus kisonensis F0435]|uniref:Uncharacterized protein n=1 Tax=Lentilactobacillus kisonensis F0435 TaxID=797516 RepID=H1LBP5_9LACO|nr:hypothetical protein HMPREF9104_00005 [Lentilactobacillus kisonensis F0435]
MLSIYLFCYIKRAHKVQGCADVLRFRKLLDGSTKLYQTWFWQESFVFPYVTGDEV